MNELFRKFAQKTSQIVGTSWVFILAVLIIAAWAISGPMFGYSDTWQLVINTSTTIITFLMVFLIQNTQNRDAKAIHLKLDELIKGVKGARTGFVNLEQMSDAELEALQKEFERLRVRTNHKDKKEAAKLENEVDAARDAKEFEENSVS
ncbi:MAG TPA: low affinity iron permease family protein [Pyrinomonadaceae bacterium]|nr:low affinity iron permease family protein [Pyrinomonadaceae bacterium]